MTDTAIRDVLIVDSDSHVTEPPDLWTARLPAKWADVAPQTFVDDTGLERWRVGDSVLYPVAKYSAAGWGEYPPSHPPTLGDADPACWDASARLERLDEYGVYAQVLYPNLIAFATPSFLDLGDPELTMACVRAYNDYLAEWASADPGRLLPIAMVPFWDRDAAIVEVERAHDLGHRGVLMSSQFDKLSATGIPPLWDPYWEPLLSTLEERRLSVNFHVGFSELDAKRIADRAKEESDDHARITSVFMMSNAKAIADIVCKGVCHRHPELKFVSVESGASWMPYLMESLDWHWRSYGAESEFPERMMPSEYIRRQVYGTYWFERESLDGALRMLPDNIMFETDFPHGTSLSPGPASPAENPRAMAEASLRGQSDEVIRKVLWENAAKLYHVTPPA